jgi:hypothetical protein
MPVLIYCFIGYKFHNYTQSPKKPKAAYLKKWGTHYSLKRTIFQYASLSPKGHKFSSLQFFRQSFVVRADCVETQKIELKPEQDEYVACINMIIDFYHFIAPQP